MLVSIIIPIYNVSNYIERCLESVYNQTYKNIEVILVDDCTPDNSMEIVDRVIEKYSASEFTKIIKHSENGGLSVTRNTGITNSSGDYLYFLDSDDSLAENNAISCLINQVSLKKYPDVVIGNLNVFLDGKFIKDSSFSIKQSQFFYLNEQIFDSFLSGKWFTMAQNKLINADFLRKKNLFFHENILHEDLLWSFTLASKSNNMILLADRTYNYFMRTQNSITSDIKEKNLEDLVFIYNKMQSLIIKNSIINDNIHLLRYMLNLKLHGILLYTIGLKRKEWVENVKNIEENIPVVYRCLTMKDLIKLTILSLPVNVLYFCLKFVQKWKKSH